MALKVNISWVDSNPTTNLDHFEIWRKTGSGGTYGKISTDIGLGVESWEDVNGGIGLVDGQEYFYQVRAYNAGGQYSLIEDSITVSDSIILFEDDFAGTVINTTTKWTDEVTSADITVTQNDMFIIVADGVTSGSFFGEYYIGKNAYTLTGGTLVLNFDIHTTSTNSIDNNWNVGMSQDANLIDNLNLFSLARWTTLNSVLLTGRVAGVNDVSEQIGSTDIRIKTQFKLAATESNLALYKWDGVSVWTELASQAISLPSGDYYPYISPRDTTSSNGQIEIDNFVVTNEDYSTQYPIGYTP